MTKPHNIPDAEIDRLLAGHAPEDSRLDDVAQFLSDVDSAYAEQPTHALEGVHVAAMVAAAQTLAEQGATADLDPKVAWKARRKGVFSFANLAAHKWATAAAVAVMGVLAFGGAAYAGVLPAPIQEVTSSCASHVGVAIPRRHVSRHSGVRKASNPPNTRKTGKTSAGAKRANGALHGAGAPSAAGIASGSTDTLGNSKAKLGAASGSVATSATAGSSAATGSAAGAGAKGTHAKARARAKAHARAKASSKATKKARKKTRHHAKKRGAVKKKRTTSSAESSETERSSEETSEAGSRRHRRRSSRG